MRRVPVLSSVSIRRDRPLRDCVMIYEDDFLYPTAEPMYRRLIAEGHDAVYLKFADIGRGHRTSQCLGWMVGCLSVVDACTPQCAESFVQCLERRGGASPQERDRAYQGVSVGASIEDSMAVSPAVRRRWTCCNRGAALYRERRVRWAGAGELSLRLSSVMISYRVGLYSTFSGG